MPTTPYSWKIATTANCSFAMPFECAPIGIWCDTPGVAKTATIEGIWGGAALPTDEEIWLETEFLGSGSSPQASFVADCKSDLLATAAPQTASGATWSGTVADPSIKLLMGFNDANGAIGAPGMADEAPVGHGNATINGAAQISTAQSIFGGSSLLLNGTSSYITFPDSNDWNLSNQPFTIEARIRPTAVSAGRYIIAQWTPAINLGFAFIIISGVLQFQISTSGADSVVVTNGGTIAVNNWYAVCVDFDGAKYRMYIDGAMVASSSTLFTVTNSTRALSIGASSDGATNFFAGWIDEVRFTVGTARYGSDAGYTVATSPFPRTSAASPFSLSTTFTPAQPGFVYCRVRCARPSSTFYIDPMVTLS